MQATLFRSHAREEMAAAESELAQAIGLFLGGFSQNSPIRGLLRQAVLAQTAGLQRYDGWNYVGVLNSAMQVLSLTNQAFTLMGAPGKIHDPLQAKFTSVLPSRFRPVNRLNLEAVTRSMTLTQYQRGLLLLSAH